MNKRLIKWMEHNWGKRCKSYDKDCGVCQAWECFDFIFNPEKTDYESPQDKRSL